MLRKLCYILLSACVFFTTNAFAATNLLSQGGLSMEYELRANDPQIFANVFFWPIKATCTIISDQSNSPISFTALHKNGVLNDILILAGDSFSLNVQSGDKLYITADSGAKFELLNHGKKTIKASCAAG